MTTANGDAVLRAIAGDVGGFSGPGSTHTPMTMVHATLAPGAAAVIPWPAEFNCSVHVLGGRGAIGRERRLIDTGYLTVLGGGDTFTVEAARRQDTRTGGMEVLLLGGQPIGEPIACMGRSS